MSVAEASAAVPLRDWRNSAPQDPAGHASRDGIGLLLRTILKYHQELGLESAQIVELSRLYWSAPLPAAADTVETIERTLSAEQFRKCIAYIATATAGDNGSATPASADIGTLIKAAVEERTKDKDAVAVDLAAKAADRLMTWMRMFGVFAALPIAAFLALLSFEGISTFHDLQEMKTKAETTLQVAQKNVDSVAERSTQVDNQIIKLSARLNAHDQNIARIDNTVRVLAEKLNFGVNSGLPRSTQTKLIQAADKFRGYFEKLGYAPKTKAINFSGKVTIPGGLSYYDPASNTIFIKPELANDETMLLHEYAHHILYSSLSFDALNEEPVWKYSATPIEYGLDAYFVGSSLNQTLIGALAARHLGPTAGVKLPLNLENTERITATQLGDNFDYALIDRLQLAWGGTFWELRQKLGQNITDRCLYEAWRTLVDQDQALVAHSFVANLAAQLESAAGKPAVEVLHDILARRGLDSADLPNAE
jgi:hypothetical protein